MRCNVLIVSTLFIHAISAQQSTYKAAVLEHAAVKADTAELTMLKNLNMYRLNVERAKEQGAQIIVFPEYGLTTLIYKDFEDYAIAIPNNGSIENKILTELREVATEYAMYLVVNLLERDSDANNETNIYNTNIVLNTKGQIISKYRKINLFNEDKLTPGDGIATFRTDFGVTFGMFICADILFQNPSRDVLVNSQVTDIIFSTAWFSTLPFYSSLSIQHGYAVANGVNLLASNYDDPKHSNGGSGIYLANGDVVEKYIDSTHSSKLIVQEVPIITKRFDRGQCPDAPISLRPRTSPTPRTVGALPGGKGKIADYVTQRDFKSSDFKFRRLQMKETPFNATETLCDGQFCCSFFIRVAEPFKNDVYKLMAFDGRTTIDRSKYHVRVCALLACENEDNDSCGSRIEPQTKFEKITIDAFVPSNSTFYTPITLTSDLVTVERIEYCNHQFDNGTSHIVQSTSQIGQNVLVFGLYGHTSSAQKIYITVMLCFISSIMVRFL